MSMKRKITLSNIFVKMYYDYGKKNYMFTNTSN